MQHISTTPFGRRPMMPAQMQRHSVPRQPVSGLSADKWQLFSALKTARRDFGLNDRNLTVLSALLSFFPERDLRGELALVVWPSNAVLSERANGIPESSLRRHLQRLIEVGLIARQDSPNGKRYARKGPCPAVFGFSLAPLLGLAAEIEAAAAAHLRRTAELQSLRESLSLMLRDIERALPDDSADHPAACLRRELRRKLPLPALQDLQTRVSALYQELLSAQGTADDTAEIPVETTKLSGSARQIERHNEDSITESYDTLNAQKITGTPPAKPGADITVADIRTRCPDIALYTQSGLNDWSDLIAAARMAFPMMGIASATWQKAETLLGPVIAALSIATILQKIQQIPNPGGYLTRLTQNGTSARRLLHSLRES